MFRTRGRPPWRLRIGDDNGYGGFDVDYPKELRVIEQSIRRGFAKRLGQLPPGDDSIKTQERIAEAFSIHVSSLKTAVQECPELRRLLVRPDGRYEVKRDDLFEATHVYVWWAFGSRRRAAVEREAGKAREAGKHKAQRRSASNS